MGQNSKSQQQNIEINLESLGLVEVIGARLGDTSAGRTPCIMIMYNGTPRACIPLKSLRDGQRKSRTTYQSFFSHDADNLLDLSTLETHNAPKWLAKPNISQGDNLKRRK
jgi:hypothetical protein